MRTFLIATLCFVFAGVISVFGVDDKIDFGVNCSVVIPEEDGADTGVYIGGLLSYDVVENLAVGIEAGYAKVNFEEADIKLGTLHTFPLLGNITAKVPIEMDNFTLTPYGIIGMGVLFSSFEESDIVEAVGISIDTDIAFLMKYGGGIDFYVTDALALNLEVSYLVADIDTDATWGGVVYAKDSLNANSWLIGGGVKIRF